MKTKLFPYISIALIASFLIAPAAQGFGPFWITLPELDTPATEDVILVPVVPDEPAVWQDLEHQFIMPLPRSVTQPLLGVSRSDLDPLPTTRLVHPTAASRQVSVKDAP